MRGQKRKERKIDLDDFSFEVAYMFSERRDKSGLYVKIDFADKVLPTIRGNQKFHRVFRRQPITA